MPNINEVIARVDAVKQNDYTQEEKARWLIELDGRIFREVMRCFGEYPPEKYPEDAEKELLVSMPYDNIYDLYLFAMIDFTNREVANYNNSAAMFDTAYEDFKKTWQRANRPPLSGSLNTMGESFGKENDASELSELIENHDKAEGAHRFLTELIARRYNALLELIEGYKRMLDGEATKEDVSAAVAEHQNSSFAHSELFESTKKEFTELVNSVTGTNIRNGEGTDSLEQVCSELDPEYPNKQSTAPARAGVALGRYNEVSGDAYCGMAVNYNNKVLARDGFAANSGNVIPKEAEGAFVAGHQNEAKNIFQTIVGTYSDVEEVDAFVVGNGSSSSNRKNAFKVDKSGNVKAGGNIEAVGEVNATRVNVTGVNATNITVTNGLSVANDISSNKKISSDSAQLGHASIASKSSSHGKSTATGLGSAAFGGANKVYGINSFAALTSNTIPENCAQVFIAGHANTAAASHQAIFGTYADPAASDIFVVGNGTSAGRKNAFAVDRSGNVRIGGNTITIGSTTITAAQWEKLLAVEGLESSAAIAEELQRLASAMSTHSSNKENPHGVTPAQIGAAKSDLSNVNAEVARANLNVYSKEEAEAILRGWTTLADVTSTTESGSISATLSEDIRLYGEALVVLKSTDSQTSTAAVNLSVGEAVFKTSDLAGQEGVIKYASIHIVDIPNIGKAVGWNNIMVSPVTSGNNVSVQFSNEVVKFDVGTRLLVYAR